MEGVPEFWDVRTGKRIAEVPPQQSGGSGVLSHDGTLFAMSGEKSAGKRLVFITLKVHEVQSGLLLWERQWDYDYFDCYPQFSPSGETLSVTGNSMTHQFFEPATGRLRGTVTDRGGYERGQQAFSLGKRFHAEQKFGKYWPQSTWIDKALAWLRIRPISDEARDWDVTRVIDRETGRAIFEVEFTNTIYSTGFAERGITTPGLWLADDGRTLATQHADHIAIWDVPSWPPLRWVVGVSLGVWVVLCVGVWLVKRRKSASRAP